jgi:hypothetical protein
MMLLQGGIKLVSEKEPPCRNDSNRLIVGQRDLDVSAKRSLSPRHTPVPKDWDKSGSASCFETVVPMLRALLALAPKQHVT